MVGNSPVILYSLFERARGSLERIAFWEGSLEWIQVRSSELVRPLQEKGPIFLFSLPELPETLEPCTPLFSLFFFFFFFFFHTLEFLDLDYFYLNHCALVIRRTHFTKGATKEGMIGGTHFFTVLKPISPFVRDLVFPLGLGLSCKQVM